MVINKGITRRVDELGRIVLPVEIRRSMNIKEKDLIDITLDEDAIILTPIGCKCICCGNKESQHNQLIKAQKTYICQSCLNAFNISEKILSIPTNK